MRFRSHSDQVFFFQIVDRSARHILFPLDFAALSLGQAEERFEYRPSNGSGNLKERLLKLKGIKGW